MTPRSVISLGLLLGLSAVSGAHAQDGAAIPKTASAETIDWAARGCNAQRPFGLRFGEAPSGTPYRLLGGNRQPFERLSLALTERSGRLFRVETVGMFQDAPGSTRSDREAGAVLFEAVDARIQALGGWGHRVRGISRHGDPEVTYSKPVDGPDSGVTLEISLMLGGVWMSCEHPDFRQQHVEEVLG